MASANLRGVWAKYDRAVEQLQLLAYEVSIFGRKSDAWASVSQVNADGTDHVRRLYPTWEPGLVYLWGTIIGEIVHDLRSALDQLVWQLVLLNGATPTRDHSFPILSKEPAESLGVHARRQWTDRRGKRRHGPLLGVSDDAVAVIDACQPYQGPHTRVLATLHGLWNLDKHQQLVPTTLTGRKPAIHVTNGAVIARRDCFDGEAYVLKFRVGLDGSGLQPHVEVKPHAPDDILLSEGESGPPVIDSLNAVASLILGDLLIPASNLFTGEDGIGYPVPARLATELPPAHEPRLSQRIRRHDC